MVWPLAGWMMAGTLPGVLIGYYLRATYFPNPRIFKFFVGLVLLFMASRLLWTVWAGRNGSKKPPADRCVIAGLTWNFKEISYLFLDRKVRIKVVPFLLVFSFFIGIVGGIYGIGGGALLIPFLVGFLGLPVYSLGRRLAVRHLCHLGCRGHHLQHRAAAGADRATRLASRISIRYRRHGRHVPGCKDVSASCRSF